MTVFIVLRESRSNPNDPFSRQTTTAVIGVFADRQQALGRAALEVNEPGVVSVTVDTRCVVGAPRALAQEATS
jgi:hypothetical protein